MNEDVCRCVGSWCVYCTKLEARMRKELADCNAKLARVEAVLFADWCQAAGYVERADDFGRLHAYVRAALADSGDKPELRGIEHDDESTYEQRERDGVCVADLFEHEEDRDPKDEDA